MYELNSDKKINQKFETNKQTALSLNFFPIFIIGRLTSTTHCKQQFRKHTIIKSSSSSDNSLLNCQQNAGIPTPKTISRFLGFSQNSQSGIT
jgi:hypothetical protein